MWCLERNIPIHVQHFPGNLNMVVNRESRSIWDRSDWKLDVNIFTRIDEIFFPLEVDLFVSRLTHQCCHYFSTESRPTSF